MKKLMILGFLALGLNGMAQMGASGGIVVSEFYNGVESNIRPKLAPTGGIYHRIKLSKTFSLQPELNYVPRGTYINKDGNGLESGRYRMRTDYAEFSTMLNLHLGNFTVGAGASLNYLTLWEIDKWNWDGAITSFDENGLKRFDYGPIAGISYDLHGAILQLNGYMGLPIIGHYGSTFSETDRTETYHHKYKNRSATLKILIPFKL